MRKLRRAKGLRLSYVLSNSKRSAVLASFVSGVLVTVLLTSTAIPTSPYVVSMVRGAPGGDLPGGGGGGGGGASPGHRLLCWVLTMPANLPTKASVIKRTWGRRCDITLYMSSEEDLDFPAVGLNTSDGGKKHNAEKAMKAWKYIHQNYLDRADFFYKVDDDTFVVVENLRRFLADKDPNRSEYYGHRFVLRNNLRKKDAQNRTVVHKVNTTYMSGGPGFVLTRRAVELLVTAYRLTPDCADPHGAGEDWKTARCLQFQGAVPVDTRDSLGRERFLVFSLRDMLGGRYPAWYYKYSSLNNPNNTKGSRCCSYYPISFHYSAKQSDMVVLEYLFYHARVSGLSEADHEAFHDFVQLKAQNVTEKVLEAGKVSVRQQQKVESEVRQEEVKEKLLNGKKVAVIHQ